MRSHLIIRTLLIIPKFKKGNKDSKRINNKIQVRQKE